MADQSRRFNFEEVDALITEALEENEVQMASIRRPGQIGAVAIRYLGSEDKAS